MPTLPPTPQHSFALEVVKTLRSAGYQSLWAGGCVRDALLGSLPKDYDVATSATPVEIRKLFGKRRTLAIGESFGVITLLGPQGAGQIEVATFRTDGGYSDGRRPDSVTFTGAEEDARRRDFTINGLFYDPVAEEVIDYVAGQRDLAAKIIRAIGDPAARIGEDKLRMLRAVRFAARFNFEIDSATLAAVQDSAKEISQVSPERIGMEIRRMLVGPNREQALTLLRKTGLLSEVLAEVAALTDTDWNATLEVISELEEPSLPVALAALLHRRGTPKVARAVVRRMRYTNKEMDRAAWLLDKLPVVAEARKSSWPTLQRVLVHDGAGELLALYEAATHADDEELAFCRQQLAQPSEELNPKPLLDGADLIAHGLTPGPDFSAILEAVRDAQLEGRITTVNDALEMVNQWNKREH